MANYLDSGENQPNQHVHTNSEFHKYLSTHNLPIQSFVQNGIELLDLKDFDDKYFEAFCKDLNLNTIQKIRFKKLLQNVNNENVDIKQQKDIQQINNQIKSIENKINTVFNDMINQLNDKKMELLDELHKISQNIDVYNNNQQKNNDNKEDVEAPKISAFIKNKNIEIHDENKYNDKRKLIITIKQNDEELKENICTQVDNSYIIKNIKPLTKYCIRAKYQITSNISSLYSKEIVIKTEFDIKWDKSATSSYNKELKFIDNDNRICCSSQCKTLCIVAKPILNLNYLKTVKFKFIFGEFCQTSMFGLISTPIYQTMNGYWSNKIIATNKNALILETMNGLNSIHRYENGIDTEKSLFSNHGIMLSKPIKKGDHFIFDINFDKNQCNVYINKCEDCTKIVTKSTPSTWSNIPNSIVPIYGHYVGSRFVQKNSDVTIQLLAYTIR